MATTAPQELANVGKADRLLQKRESELDKARADFVLTLYWGFGPSIGTKAPARRGAADRILDRVLGKVGERLELTGRNRGPVEVRPIRIDRDEVRRQLLELGLIAPRLEQGAGRA
jgi:hypothetical protein